MEATISVADGATLEFNVEETRDSWGSSGHRHLCTLRADKIKARIFLLTPPYISGNGLTIDNTTARITTIAQWVYARDNPMGVQVPGWGEGYDPQEDLATEWRNTIHSSICQPYTDLLRESSLESLAVKLLADSHQLREDYVRRYFQTLLGGFRLFPDADKFEELLQGHLDHKSVERRGSPFYNYLLQELRRLHTDKQQRSIAEDVFYHHRRQGHFAP